MTRTLFPALRSGSVLAMLAAGLAVEAPSRVIENNGQAMPKGAQRAIRDARSTGKDHSRKAAEELVRISNQTLVVAHLHPRWLRQMVERAMDLGAEVTLADVDAMRAAGPDCDPVLYFGQRLVVARG